MTPITMADANKVCRSGLGCRSRGCWSGLQGCKQFTVPMCAAANNILFGFGNLSLNLWVITTAPGTSTSNMQLQCQLSGDNLGHTGIMDRLAPLGYLSTLKFGKVP